MNRAFVDTWAWYALVDIADRDHQAAQQASERLLDEGSTFVTTNFVISETLTLIRYHLHHPAAIRFWHTTQELIDGGLVERVRVSEAHERAAWEIFEGYADQEFSFVDCTSFAVMRDLHIARAFTAEHHFAICGFVLVP